MSFCSWVCCRCSCWLASVFLLRIKDQNLILGIRLDESTKRQEAISQKNFELQREIAEREEVERALRASEGKYRELHQSMRDGFVSFSITGQVIEWNAAFLEMLGMRSMKSRRLPMPS